MLICLERELTHEIIKAMASREPRPERVVCLDVGFAGNDQLKVNTVETMKVRRHELPQVSEIPNGRTRGVNLVRMLTFNFEHETTCFERDENVPLRPD